MNKIIPKNSAGVPITELVQWDQDIYIEFEDMALSKAYRVHFFNNSSEEALVVDSTLEKENTIRVKVPNILLCQDKTIFGYIIISDGEETSSKLFFSILIRKKPMPSNYIYVDSDDYISVEEILGRVTIGGTQILRKTNEAVALVSSMGTGWADGRWRSSSPGAGARTCVEITDVPNPSIIVGWRINNTDDKPTDISQDIIPLRQGQYYTTSCYVRGGRNGEVPGWIFTL